ncbi:hypothetical protein M5K25_007065 [Dendrobium thyrsiflorum]|uniref:Uncharacterized protein n=1 Tax=Dendrobium thyrsiflorum TaxID=117978 RepID=A0ABD0VKI0_DENTH
MRIGSMGARVTSCGCTNPWPLLKSSKDGENKWENHARWKNHMICEIRKIFDCMIRLEGLGEVTRRRELETSHVVTAE